MITFSWANQGRASKDSWSSWWPYTCSKVKRIQLFYFSTQIAWMRSACLVDKDTFCQSNLPTYAKHIYYCHSPAAWLCLQWYCKRYKRLEGQRAPLHGQFRTVRINFVLLTQSLCNTCHCLLSCVIASWVVGSSTVREAAARSGATFNTYEPSQLSCAWPSWIARLKCVGSLGKELFLG
jgi:hypothetical protein